MPDLYSEMSDTLERSQNSMQFFLEAATQELREQFPTTLKAYTRTFKTVEVADLLNISTTAITRAETTLNIDVPKSTVSNRREGYTLEQVHLLRNYFGRSPRKPDDAESVILSVASGKGGVGKSTCAGLMAEYFALQGYRVLLVDTDPQATATTFLLGVNPDMVFGYEDTIAPFLVGQDGSLKERVVRSGMPGLSVIPSCQSTSVGDIKGIQGTGQQIVDGFLRLKAGLGEFKSDYDLIILDCAPSVTYTNLRSILSANIIIHPVVPELPDYASASNYESAILQYLELLKEVDPSITFPIHSRKYLISRYNHRQDTNRMIAELIQKSFPCYQAKLDELTEVHNTVNRNTSIYQNSKPVGSLQTRRKALANLDNVFSEIGTDIRELYPHPDFSKSPVTLRAEQGYTPETDTEISRVA